MWLSGWPLSFGTSFRVSQAVSGVEILLLQWPIAFYCMGLPYLGSIYPDRVLRGFSS